MNTQDFTHTPPQGNLPLLKAKNVNGKRFYEIIETKKIFPSITSVLSIRQKEGLVEWRKKVGDDVANHIMITAANRGKAVHSMVEDYLNNLDINSNEKYKKQFLPKMMFNVLQPELKKINSICLQEAQMYSEKYTVAGRCDCIAEYDGVLSVIDFKTSKGEKKEDWIENYFIQGSAYAEMYEEHFNKPIEQVVILIVTEEGTTQIFKKNKNDYLPKLKDAIEKFYKWVENGENI
jgi:genome maintenance exonuclease 1|tara:strand:- start:190 stop:891 length:702 start_codon:yes stop_codon:yes gene_type:complete